LRIFSTTDFAEGLIDQISQRWPVLSSTSAGIYSLGLYAMDEWRVNSSLKLSLGLRIDRNSNGVCYQNCFSRLPSTFADVNHDATIPYNQLFVNGLSNAFPDLQAVVWEPRIGFAWTPNTKFSKPGTTVIRGGVGLFSDLYPGTLIDNSMHNATALKTFTLSTAPAFSTAEPSNAYAAEATCNSIFNSVFANGGTRADYRNQARAALGFPCPGPDYNSFSNKIQNPMFVEWNLEVQQAIGSKSMVSFNYVGNHGYDTFTNNAYANAWGGRLAPFSGLPNAAPDVRVNNVSNLSNNGISNYNGLSVSFTQRSTKGLTFTFNYTYSHTSDMTSNGGILPYSGNDSLLGITNPNCFSCNYANADYDVRHNISANYVWQLPFKFSNKMVETLAGGWQISGTFFYRGGLPFSVIDGNVPSFLGNAVNVYPSYLAVPTSISALPTTCGTSAANTYTANPTPCLNNSMFQPTETETGFSPLTRNSFRGPGYFNSDFSVLKNFHLTERYVFALGANMYNVFNHPNFANPVNDVSSGQFGSIVSTVVPPTSPYGAFVGSAVSGRQIQVTARFTF
jgi:hypothetical protein